jgi:hypothetical protein
MVAGHYFFKEAFMMTIVAILILGITVEALIEYGKLIFTKTINWKQIVALCLGVLLAVAANVDLYALVGVSFVIPYVGVVLTGIIFSRGSNYAADFIKLIQGVAAKKADALLDSGGDTDTTDETETANTEDDSDE